MRGNFCRSLLVASIFIAVVGLTVTATAIRPPPAQLIDQSVSPACLTVTHTFVGDQPAGWGTGNKGPALSIENNCPTAFAINKIETMKEGDTSLTPHMPGSIYLVLTSGETTVHQEMVFAANESACEAARGIVEKRRQKQKEARETRERLLAEAKERDETNPIIQWLIGKDDYAAKGRPVENKLQYRVEDAVLACGELSLPSGGVITLGMPWGNTYLIMGDAPGDQPNLSVSGKMINPEDPASTDAVKLAENGDNRVRHTLAVKYLERGQNIDTAIRWLKAAAAEGFMPAQYQLSTCYTLGHHIEKNPEEGYFWFLLAFGDKPIDESPYMARKRDAAAKELTAAQISSVEKRVAEWRKSHPIPQSK